MSYDLAVWDGDRPADDEAAGRHFDELYDRYLASGEKHPPAERVQAYVTALLARWPDLGDDDDDTSPWSTGPLINEARGPVIYFPLRHSMYEEAAEYAAEVAASMGLVCYDPQAGQLLA